MNCKEYIMKAHHPFFISFDDEETLQDIPASMNQKPDTSYTVTKDDYSAWERSMDVEPNFDVLPDGKNASGLRGPQGKKGYYDGVKFDSMWEYAFYRYHKEICGDVITRNHDEWVPYYDEKGQQRKFFYDFVVNSIPYEVKGILRPSDLLKQQASSGIVTFVLGSEIKPMMKELDANSPNWREDYIES